MIGKGQFICACKTCSKKKDLKTWEVNFAYQEEGLKKNALIKISEYPRNYILDYYLPILLPMFS